MEKTGFTIIISRCDALGDMVLTIPMAGFLKSRFPDCRIYYLARNYTLPAIDRSSHIDGFIEYDYLIGLNPKDQVEYLKSFAADIFVNVLPKKELAFLAKKAGIPLRIGTTNRWYHWFTCNRLIRLSRKRSDLHEAQLNIRLLGALTPSVDIPLSRVHEYYGTIQPDIKTFDFLPDTTKKKIILHPKSNGSGKEWNIKNYVKLIELLPPEKYQVVVSGLPHEAGSIAPLIKNFPHVVNAIGRLTLTEFIQLIAQSEALVASGTGPLHLAAMMGIKAIGLFPQRKNIGPGRWQPIGRKARFLTFSYVCENCKQNQDCDCINRITPEEVFEQIER